MSVEWPIFIWGALISFVTACAATPLMIRLAHRTGFLDNPAHRKFHAAPVPYLGGVAILVGLVAGLLTLWLLWPEVFTGLAADGRLEIILAAVMAAAGIGIIDDKFQIRARYKFVCQFLIITVFAGFGYHFNTLSLPGLQDAMPLKFFGIPLTVLWMLSVVNGINLIDGIDGLAGSTICAICISIWGVAWALHDPMIPLLAACAAGATLGFLLFNWKPARIYLGDGGSSALGMLIACTLVATGQHQTAESSLPGEPEKFYMLGAWLVVIYPLLEVTLTTVRRRLAGKSIASADRGHIHHRLVQRNWPVPRIVLTAALISILAGLAVLMTILGYRGLAAGCLMALSLLCGIVVHTCDYVSVLAASQNVRPHFLIANYFVSMQKMKLELAQSLAEVAALINQAAIEFGVRSYTISIRNFSGEEKGEEKTEWTWRRPEAPLAQGQAAKSSATLRSAGRTDQAELPESGAKAVWLFEVCGDESDIEIEYRLLMAEFMKKALFTILPFCSQPGQLPASAVQNCDPALISSNALKHRISIRKNEILPAAGAPENLPAQ
jgi:UDP-GlcNAc:undecaprenyl-phosphate GlcNAc-1-phosphate transferase